MMKKVLSVIITAGIVLSLSGCALTNNGGSAAGTPSPAPTATADVEEPTPAPTAVPEATAAPEATAEPGEPADPVVAHQTKSETETGALPAIEGPEDFVEKFNDNEIDQYYTDEMKTAASVTEMVEVTNKAAQAWETQLNTAFDKLADAVNIDADENERINKEQQAWANDINAMVDEIKSAAGDGSMANVEISTGVMLMYRGRCVELLSELFNKTGDFTIKMSSSEAVG